MDFKHYLGIFLALVLSHRCLAQKLAKTKCGTFKVDKNLPPSASKNDFGIFVTGGVPTADNEFPHMVALGYGDTPALDYLCGGSLISEDFVLTAAHCTSIKGPGPVKMIRAGSRKLTGPKGFQLAPVSRIINHPRYRSPGSYDDIALLKLEKKLSYTINVLPACLHTTKNLAANQQMLTAIGWGKVDFAGPPTDNLQKVSLQYSPFPKCMASYRDVSKDKLPRGLMDRIQICAGGQVGKDTCSGDSGGPLGYKKGTVHYIVGVTSFGKACGLTGDPGVYARVSEYVPWIESIVWSSANDNKIFFPK